tara:strand:+ start:693 stop:5036 length:4344 start_codon:yes stop_codon:yes gene_type:complete
MSTVKGIFVPFYQYVQDQLQVRQTLIASAQTIKFLAPGSNVPIEIPAEFANNFNLYQRGGIYSSDAFYGYTVEKQCIMRMISGVDLRINSDGLNKIFKSEMNIPHLKYLTAKGENLAKQYILESGTQFYNEGGNFGGLREGFIPDNLEDPSRGFAYGDQNIRSNAGDDFGIVPMPGLIDAEIRTKSDNGSLREAIVNFVCHNRRQLEVLEMLYMRPGMPIVLEWGWNPYIDNKGNKQVNNFSVREQFFKNTSTMDSIMGLIREYKESSGGNFDGIMGYCKNFSFKANELGGYDCTTEIMSYGEIIETLKSQTVFKETTDSDNEETVAEIEDSLLYYLRSIKNTLRSPTSILSYQGAGADVKNESRTENFESFTYTRNNQEITVPARKNREIKTWEDMRTPLGYVGNGCPSFYGQDRLIAINYTEAGIFQCVYENNVVIPVKVDNQAAKEGFIPEPYDLNLYKDKTKEVTVTKDYLKNMSYDDYSYFMTSGQYGDDTTPDVYGYLATQAKARVGTGLWRGFKGFFDNGEWGKQIDALEQAGINAPQANYTEAQLRESIKARQQNLKNLNTKLKGYKKGYLDVVNLVHFINKLSDKQPISTEGIPSPNDKSGVGLEAFLNGTIVKQVVKYDQQGADSGYRKNIYIRWDLVCQIINHLCIYKDTRISDIKDDMESDEYNDEYISIQNNYKLKEPGTELTYMVPNKRTWHNGPSGKGKSPKGKNGPQSDYYYIPYTAPYVRSTDPVQSVSIPTNQVEANKAKAEDISRKLKELNIQLKLNTLSDTYNFNFQDEQGLAVDTNLNPEILRIQDQLDFNLAQYIEESEPNNVVVDFTKKKLIPNKDYHPIIGASLDESICLMPHQPIFDELFEKNQTSYKELGKTDRNLVSEDTIVDLDDKSMGSFKALTSYYSKKSSGFFEDVMKSSERHSIGFVYFNIDFLIERFMEMRLKQYQSDSNDKLSTLNNKFAYHDYITSIWDAANAATGNYYNFTLHCEHERSNINRIIDLRVSGKVDVNDRPIFEFSPQGLRSVTRQFYYDTSISNDLASAIAIAARNPRDMEEIDSLSFKAFNKNIKNRFVQEDEDEIQRLTKKKDKENLTKDINQYTTTFNTLIFYLQKLYEGNRQVETIQTTTGLTLTSISMGSALMHLEKLRNLRVSINYRVPLKNENGKDNDNAGAYLVEGFNQDFSPIIPIQFNFEMDGMAGLIPLQMFKIDPSRLPLGYEASSKNMAFIVNSESQKINQNQDWTVQVSGQMVFLNTEDIKGSNVIDENVLDFNTRNATILSNQSSKEQSTTNADLLRNVLVQFGHSENNYVGERDGYLSGELSSGGDISSETKEFGIFFIKALDNPTNFGLKDHGLGKVKLRFTAGNDIYHQENRATRNSKHRIGNGLDFVLRTGNSDKELDALLDFLKEIKKLKYPRLYIKDEYRYPPVGKRNATTTGPHIHIDFR